MIIRTTRALGLVAVALALVVACAPASSTSLPPTASPSPAPGGPSDSPMVTPGGNPSVSPIATPAGRSSAAPSSPTGSSELVAGLAPVEEIELLLLESFPVQVRAVIRGYLPDGCTHVDKVEQSRVGNEFRVRITTSRPADAMCTQVVIPLEETVALDVEGLPAGTYTVDVNGVTASFTLDVDNSLP
jgi:inhibitor of cysteine peptidase